MDIAVNDIKSMDRKNLLDLWCKLFDNKPPKRISIPFLRRILAFDVQSRIEGGMSASTSAKLNRLETYGSRTKSLNLTIGARLLREWNGVTHVVDVVENGFLWRKERYRSLSAVARTITGAHWSGPRFFGLSRGGQK